MTQQQQRKYSDPQTLSYSEAFQTLDPDGERQLKSEENIASDIYYRGRSNHSNVEQDILSDILWFFKKPHEHEQVYPYDILLVIKMIEDYMKDHNLWDVNVLDEVTTDKAGKELLLLALHILKPEWVIEKEQ